MSTIRGMISWRTDTDPPLQYYKRKSYRKSRWKRKWNREENNYKKRISPPINQIIFYAMRH